MKTAKRNPWLGATIVATGLVLAIWASYGLGAARMGERVEWRLTVDGHPDLSARVFANSNAGTVCILGRIGYVLPLGGGTVLAAPARGLRQLGRTLYDFRDLEADAAGNSPDWKPNLHLEGNELVFLDLQDRTIRIRVEN